MARTVICGFEANDNITGNLTTQAVDGRLQGTGATIDTTTVRSGTYALKIALTSGTAGYFLSQHNLSNGRYTRFYLRVTALPSSTARKLFGNTTGIHLRLNPAGTLALYNNTTLIGTTTTALTDTTKWYRIEIRLADGTSVPTVLIDGNTEITASPASWTMAPLHIGANDTVADTYTAYFDDLTEDDAGFPGDGKVVLLLPESDNTRTNWTAGAGATTSLFAAVDNLPPAGVASASETNTSNIESASSTGTATYIAAMSTYSSKGIAAGDTVNAIDIMILHGEDIATGTKNGTFELTSNPVVGSTAFAFGNDAGAHGAYNASTGIWPFAETFQNAPTVTVGNAPLFKVVKTDTTTRVACICFMGIYVDYTPAVVDPYPASYMENLPSYIPTTVRM